MATTKHYIVEAISPSQLVQNEVQTVFGGNIIPDGIPDRNAARVVISGYTEIGWNEEITSATQYKVNYDTNEGFNG